MVLIPGGEFLMGQENGRDEERPVHPGDGCAVSIGRFRVTNRDFAALREFAFDGAMLPVTPVIKNYLDPNSTHGPVIGSIPKRACSATQRSSGLQMGGPSIFAATALASSNQRAGKGFEPTFSMKRDFGGLVGRYKRTGFSSSPTSRNRAPII